MFTIILTIAMAFLYSEAIGFLVHRLAHSTKSGPLYRSHMRHHVELYPPSRFTSDKYLSAGVPLTLWFLPLFALSAAAAILLIPGSAAYVASTTIAASGLANLYFHDALHVERHPLAKAKWFRSIRETHRVHHRNMRKNFGIYFFFFDRLFGSFRSPPSAVTSAEDPGLSRP